MLATGLCLQELKDFYEILFPGNFMAFILGLFLSTSHIERALFYDQDISDALTQHNYIDNSFTAKRLIDRKRLSVKELKEKRVKRISHRL